MLVKKEWNPCLHHQLAPPLVYSLILLAGTINAQALEVNISEELPYVNITYAGKHVRIERIQDTDNRLTNSFTKTSRKCPPFCIHPVKVAPGVTTVGELELLDFLLTNVRSGEGLLVDARTPAWHRKGTIPSAINIPFTVCTAPANDPNLIKVLKALGGKRNASGLWDFRDAKQMLLFCNGPWCDQSPRAIKGLMRHGYPPEKLYYYRGGMQNWQLFGLTTVTPSG
ncbi:MAG: rhodanese-like domain-containing protein [Gammaproteobacteria bacterium]|nr:rhodanese-like domain-containing protein [Gammaproteobacteria bacterium]